MKCTLVALIVFFTPILAPAQKHTVYADVGIPIGVSATYNYKLTKNLGAGMGIQGIKFRHPGDHLLLPEDITNRFTPAIYVDIRLTAWATKKNQLITFLDFGMNFYKQNKTYYRDDNTVFNVPHNNGFYTGLGLGYFRRMTKLGGGPYLSLKLVSNWFTVKEYNIVSTDQDRVLWALDLIPALSLGFKF